MRSYHTLGVMKKVTFSQILDLNRASKLGGFTKIKACGEQALADGYEWIWIDTCCIDKSSSSELSEAINSMYKWYQISQVCYAYLEDVPEASDPQLQALQMAYQNEFELKDDLPHDTKRFIMQFARSRWFSRGWTLQELIAPRIVEFYNQSWKIVGTKASLEAVLQSVTGGSAGRFKGHATIHLVGRRTDVMGFHPRHIEGGRYCVLSPRHL